MLIALLVSLVLGALLYAWILVRAALARGQFAVGGEAVALGAITNFFDTLGIGSFAPTMAWLKFRGLVPDRLIPPTMIVGHSLPTIAQAGIFLVLLGVRVDPVLLVGCAIALLMGGLLGAPLVARAPVRLVQAVVGVALVLAAILYALANLGVMPTGGAAGSLPPLQTLIAVAASFVMGVLLNFGIGHYAPTLALLSLMGMDPRLCFPVMAFGGALTVVGASSRHITIGEIDLRIVIGMALGGVPAVLIAAFAVKSMPIEVLRWLVTAVVLYAAVVMLRAAARPEARVAKAPAPL
jgi:uncharacterized membrane protein YfcA